MVDAASYEDQEIRELQSEENPKNCDIKKWISLNRRSYLGGLVSAVRNTMPVKALLGMTNRKTTPPHLSTPIEYLSKMGYKIGKTIGEGSYCKVKLGEHGQKRLAAKIISRKKSSEVFVDRFLPREMSLLSEIRHPNIIQTYQIVDFGEEVYIFMELAEKGDLLELIRKRGAIPENICRNYFTQLANAVNYLHNKNISHRDLKCENVLLSKDDTIKLTDFGFSRKCVNQENGKRVLSKTYCGSAAYASPEVLMGIPYNPKMYDIWSLGCILFIMVTGKMPFDDSDVKKMVAVQLHRKLLFPQKRVISTECKALIYHMLEPDITRRATPNQLLRHKWFQN